MYRKTFFCSFFVVKFKYELGMQIMYLLKESNNLQIFQN